MMEERPFTQKLLESEPMLYRIACALLRSGRTPCRRPR